MVLQRANTAIFNSGDLLLRHIGICVASPVRVLWSLDARGRRRARRNVLPRPTGCGSSAVRAWATSCPPGPRLAGHLARGHRPRGAAPHRGPAALRRPRVALRAGRAPEPLHLGDAAPRGHLRRPRVEPPPAALGDRHRRRLPPRHRRSSTSASSASPIYLAYLAFLPDDVAERSAAGQRPGRWRRARTARRLPDAHSLDREVALGVPAARTRQADGRPTEQDRDGSWVVAEAVAGAVHDARARRRRGRRPADAGVEHGPRSSSLPWTTSSGGAPTSGRTRPPHRAARAPGSTPAGNVGVDDADLAACSRRRLGGRPVVEVGRPPRKATPAHLGRRPPL